MSATADIVRKRYSHLPDSRTAELAQKGDIRACEHLLYKYRGLVRTKTRSYFLVGADQEDLLQVGMIGLWQSVMDFAPEKEITFLAFARICVERHMITAIKASTRLKQSPLNNSVSLEYYAQESNDFCLADLLVSDVELDPEELLLHREDQRTLCEALKEMLSDFEWEVLKQYYLGRSYREIARQLRCSTKSVDNALGRIKRKVSSKCLVKAG
jgi:RNA polymerase sporulation-specific sigma factor